MLGMTRDPLARGTVISSFFYCWPPWVRIQSTIFPSWTDLNCRNRQGIITSWFMKGLKRLLQTRRNYPPPYLECSLCRLIRRSEHLIGRHWYPPPNWRSFIRWSPDQSVLAIECYRSFYCLCSVSLWLVLVSDQSACALNTQYITGAKASHEMVRRVGSSVEDSNSKLPRYKSNSAICWE
jgi:hypothetical protein